MLGDFSHRLVLEAKRSKNLETIPLYDEDTIRSIIRETNILNNRVETLDSQDDSTQESQSISKNIQTFVGHLIMRRNKRALLAYERQRIDKLCKIVWDNVEQDNTVMENLNYVEKQYLEKYNDLVVDYKNEFPDIDLSGSLEPPNEVFIDVRVLKDAGEIQTEYGVFNLTKDSQFFVRHADVERLIQQGYLKKL